MYNFKLKNGNLLDFKIDGIFQSINNTVGYLNLK